MLKFLELLELCVDLLVPLRLRGHVLERVEALVETAVRRARRVYGLFAVKQNSDMSERGIPCMVAR